MVSGVPSGFSPCNETVNVTLLGYRPRACKSAMIESKPAFRLFGGLPLVHWRKLVHSGAKDKRSSINPFFFGLALLARTFVLVYSVKLPFFPQKSLWTFNTICPE